MGKVVTIALREFLDTVRTRAFILTSVLMPLVIMGFVFAAQSFSDMAEGEKLPLRRIALLDETGALADAMAKQVGAFNVANPNQPFELELPQSPDVDELTQRIREGKLYAYLRVPAGVLEGKAPAELARKDRQLRAGEALRRMLNAAVEQVRFAQSDPPIDPEYVAKLQQPVELETVDLQTGEIGKDDTFVSLVTPFAAMFVLFMGTVQISYGLLTSVLEEKSSRVIEVLLAAVSPMQLMAGKIAGMVFVGLLLLSIWSGVGYAVAEARGYSNAISLQLLAFAGLYFLPGFLLYSALLAAIGSACNTLKDAQSLASPITIVNIVPMLLWLPISQSPQAAFSLVLSFIPPFTPFVMILRVCADPHIPWWQILGTQLVLWASVFGAVWAASKIFRIGILMYGKPPTLRELARWVRYA